MGRNKLSWGDVRDIQEEKGETWGRECRKRCIPRSMIILMMMMVMHLQHSYNKERDNMRWRRKRGNVHAITAAARKRLIEWHLAQQASVPRSWWKKERMGSDRGEKRWNRGSEGFRDVGDVKRTVFEGFKTWGTASTTRERTHNQRFQMWIHTDGGKRDWKILAWEANGGKFNVPERGSGWRWWWEAGDDMPDDAYS